MLGPNTPTVTKLNWTLLQKEWEIKNLLRGKYAHFKDRDIDYLYFVLDDSEYKEKFIEMFLGLLKRPKLPHFSILKGKLCRLTSYYFIYNSVSYMYIPDDDYTGKLAHSDCSTEEWIFNHDLKFNDSQLKHKTLFETKIPIGENRFLPEHRLWRAYLKLRFPEIDSDDISCLYFGHVKIDLVLSLLLGIYEREWADNQINTYPFNNTFSGEPDYIENINDYFKCIFFNPLKKKVRFKAYRNVVKMKHQFSEYYECDIAVFMKEVINYDRIRFKEMD